MTKNESPIGIFDSGVGGLTVAAEVMKELPGENIVYFGDTARVPYGSKSKKTVTKYAVEIMEFLIKKNVKAVIIACNTVSSNSYEELNKLFQIPIVEMVRNGVLSPDFEKIKKVGVIGTPATISSRAYEKEIKRRYPGTEVYTKACPLFVPLAEEGFTENEIARLTCETYLRPLLNEKIEGLLLGCTHYPLLTKTIKSTAGDGVSIINPAVWAAKDMKRYLTENGILNKSDKKPEHKFYLSDMTAAFGEISALVLKRNVDAEVVDIV